MFLRKHLLSVALFLVLIPISVGVIAYRVIAFPSPVSSAKTAIVNPLAPASSVPTQPAVQAPSFDAATVEKYLTVEAALLGADDHVSIYMKDEGADKDVSINSVRSWIPASTIKSFVAIEAFRQRDAGLINFDSTVTIAAQNVVPTELETDEFPRLREGTQATIGQLVQAMIIQSDNTAYNTLLDILDRKNINSTLRSIGITQTVVGEKLNMDDTQFQADLQVPGRQPNTITAKDLSTLFDLLYTGKIAHSDEILAVFEQQKINTMIPALLPPDTVVAHKTGDWAPIYHDGGIVYKPNDPFILSIFTDTNDPNVLAQLARVAYYRTSKVVGEDIPASPKVQAEGQSNTDRIYLAEVPPPTNVLGVQIDAASGERIYTVEPGDTLWSISVAQYGSGYEYSNIISRNTITDPGNITAGTVLYLPPIPGTSFVPEAQNPALNAADLGVTADDLKITKAQTRTISHSFILPGSPLYLLKQWWLSRRVDTAPTNDTKIDALLSVSTSKLADVKSELTFGNVSSVQQLLAQSEDALRQAINLAKLSSNNDVALFKIKQQRDVHFSVLNETVPSVGSSQKEAFVNAVYAFYTKEKQDVQPAVASLHQTSPLQQQPVVGTVSDIKDNIATVRKDDGKIVEVILTPLTPARMYDQTSEGTATSIRVGEKLAVVGAVTPESIVTPEFILRDVPKELPAGHRGTVLEINPKEHTITIQNTQGKIDTVVVNDATTIKSKDTDVSIAGIKAGSTITVVGNVVMPKSKVTANPTTTGVVNPTAAGGTPAPQVTGSQNVIESNITPTFGVTLPKGTTQAPTTGPRQTIPTSSAKPGTTPPASTKTTPLPLNGKTTTSTAAPVGQTVHANTVTVDKNASGKNEKVTSSKSSSGGNQPSGSRKSQESKPAPPPPAPPPKPPETKPEDKKK